MTNSSRRHLANVVVEVGEKGVVAEVETLVDVVGSRAEGEVVGSRAEEVVAEEVAGER